MGVIGKPLNEWTLGEVKTYCCEHEDCNECRFHSCGRCDLRNVPGSWNMLLRVYKPESTQALHETSKPRLAELLGVEVGEKIFIMNTAFSTKPFTVPSDVVDLLDARECKAVLYAICHPESIIRSPRLTEPEIAICTAVGAKWVSRDAGDNLGWVYLWDKKPKEEDGDYFTEEKRHSPDRLNSRKFPSVHPGDLIEIPERGITNA